MADQKVNVVIGVVDNATSKINAFGKTVSDLQTKIRPIATVAAAVFASVSALVIKSAMDFAAMGEQFDKWNLSSGMSVQSLAALKTKTDELGMSMDTVTQGVKFMQKNLEAMGANSKLAAEDLKPLGLTLSDLKALKPEDQMMTIGNAIAKIQDPAQKTTLAMKIFGKSGTDLIPIFGDGSKSMQNFTEYSKKMGTAMDEVSLDKARKLDNAFDGLKTSVSGLKQKIAEATSGDLTNFSVKITEVVERLQTWISTHQPLFANILKAITIVSGFVMGLYAATTAIKVLVSAYNLIISGTGAVGFAIAGLSFLIYELGVHWKGLVFLMAAVWNEIIFLVQDGVNSVVGGLQFLAEKIPLVGDKLGNFAGKLKIDLGGVTINGDELRAKLNQMGSETPPILEKAGAQISTSLGSVGDSFQDTGGKAKDSMEKMAASVKTETDKIKTDAESVTEKLKGIKQSLADLVGDYSTKEKEDKQKLAEAIVGSEKKVADIKKDQADVAKQLVTEEDQTRRAELLKKKAELDAALVAEQLSQKNNAALIKQLSNEVSEVKRVNSLTDLSRAVENFQAERLAAAENFQLKLGLLADELKATSGQKNDILKEIKLLNDDIQLKAKGTTTAYQAELKTQLDSVRTTTSDMIQMYLAVADAQRNAMSGASTSSLSKTVSKTSTISKKASGGWVDAGTPYIVGEQGQELFVPSQSGTIIPNGGMGTTINNYISGIFGSNAVEELGNKLAKRLLGHVSV